MSKNLLKHLDTLTRRQHDRLLALLQPAAKLDQAIGLIEQEVAGRLACPACASSKLYCHGHAYGLQRYRCCGCGRTCNALTGALLARLRHKQHWLDYLAHMLDSRNVRRTAADLGVASTTSFRWRHRFLTLSTEAPCSDGPGSAKPMRRMCSNPTRARARWIVHGASAAAKRQKIVFQMSGYTTWSRVTAPGRRSTGS